MADTHACVICKKNRAGRFTRRASGASGAWTKNSLPAWFCWACLPKGQGRGEDEEPTTVTVTAVAPPPSPKTLLADKREGLALISPLQAATAKVGMVLRDKADYAAADEVLAKVQTARKVWRGKLYGTKETPGPIPSIKAGLDMLYALYNEVEKPLDELEKGIKGRMVAFKTLELQENRRKEQERLQAEQEAARKLEEAAKKQEAARTPLQRAKAAEAVEEAETEYVEAITTVIAETKAEHSGTRTPKKPMVDDVLKFCQAIADGEIPTECIEVKQSVLNRLYKEDAATVAAFPGVTIKDDIQIVGRA